MSTVKFATYGPNRGLTLNIGAYQFVDGVCEIAEKDAANASSILTRYHDVCYAHELEQKIAEYDAAQQNREAAKSGNPQPEKPKTPPATPEKGQNPESGQNPPAADPADTGKEKEPPAGDANEGDGEPKKNGNAAGNGKKPPVKN